MNMSIKFALVWDFYVRFLGEIQFYKDWLVGKRPDDLCSLMFVFETQNDVE